MNIAFMANLEIGVTEGKFVIKIAGDVADSLKLIKDMDKVMEELRKGRIEAHRGELRELKIEDDKGKDGKLKVDKGNVIVTF